MASRATLSPHIILIRAHSVRGIMVHRGFWLLGVMLALSHGFQLRVPASLQPMTSRSLGTRTVTSKPISSSSGTVEPPAVTAREGSRDEEGFDWRNNVSGEQSSLMRDRTAGCIGCTRRYAPRRNRHARSRHNFFFSSVPGTLLIQQYMNPLERYFFFSR